VTKQKIEKEQEIEKEVREAVKHFYWLFTADSVMWRCGFPKSKRKLVVKILTQMTEEGTLCLYSDTYSKQ